jgi:hypothetical protein
MSFKERRVNKTLSPAPTSIYIISGLILSIFSNDISWIAGISKLVNLDTSCFYCFHAQHYL